MCDYSLHSVKSRPAKVGDRLTTRDLAVCTENSNTHVVMVKPAEDRI